jgi:transcription termination/antitermination protein NusA
MLRGWIVVVAVTWAFGSVALGSEACDEVLQIARSTHPEMVAGRIEISACARIPGVGTKLVVRGPEDPVEAFVGPDGQHIRIVVEALDGERVDVVPHTDDPALAAVYAVTPLTVRRVVIDEGSHAMDLVVADEELKGATGEGAFHLKLAAELTGWSLKAVSMSQDETRRDETIR